jgi:Predicted periplasmic lipoprotein (DUF2279)
MSKNLLLGLWLLAHTLGAQAPADSLTQQTDTLRQPHRLRTLLLAEAGLYTATIAGLSLAWYQDPLTQFKFYDDNYEWLQIDKVGHFYTAYHLTRVSEKGYHWAGLPKRKAALYGALTGMTFMTTIEILDGFAPEYGFSWGDMATNFLGPAAFYGQELLWGEQRIKPRWSFSPTPYAGVRPQVLGRSWNEQWLKDYNGQTYWLSGNIASFLKKGNRFPKWLNVAVGYGIDQMINADPSKSTQAGYVPYRQYYLALDVDLSGLRPKSKVLRTLLFLLDQVKVPAPALEWNPQGGFRVHALHF